MTTDIKVRLRRSPVAGRPGVIVYWLVRGAESRRIVSDIRLDASRWDSRRQCVINPLHDPHLEALERCIRREVAKLKTLVADYAGKGLCMLAGIVETFRAGENGFLMQGEKIAAAVAEQGQLGTAANYRRTLSSFAGFLSGTDIALPALDETIVVEYEHWLKRRGVVRNTVSFYMRNLRAICNRLRRMDRLERTDFFDRVYTGIDRTRKRAADEEVIARMKRLDLPPSLAFARDLFLFSFYCRGMAFVDMAYLERGNLRGGVIRYFRHKTGCGLEIGIEPCMQEIIDRYRSDSDRVFPIVRSREEQTAYREYRVGICTYNRRLKRIGELLGLSSPLSSYVSRHSWATIARNRQIPLSLISEGMGHTSERTTRIYLASFDRHLIDEANSRVIDI